MKKISLMILLLFLAYFLVGCFTSPQPIELDNGFVHETIEEWHGESAEELILSELDVITALKSEQDKTALSQVQAYFLVFEYLFETDPALNHEIKYIALDLSETMLETPDNFIWILEEFCVQNNFTLLLDNFDGLVEKGYIRDIGSGFEEGILISFRDTALTDDTLTTDASKWRSGLGAIGATFTVEKSDGDWEILPLESMWIS
jgi:hypothetical protein